MRRTLFVLIVGLLGASVLCGLGVWQLQRLAWKQGVLARIDARIGAMPVPVPKSPDPESDRYLAVEARGTIEPGEIRVYASVKGVGPGYRIISPFRTGDRVILLDRGFLPIGLADETRVTGEAEVRGNLHWPDEVDGFTPDPDRANRLWFARDVPSMAAELGAEPVLLIAATRTDPNIMPLPVDSAGVPNDHLQYAITWFLLAIAWLGMTFLFYRRSQPAGSRARGPIE